MELERERDAPTTDSNGVLIVTVIFLVTGNRDFGTIFIAVVCNLIKRSPSARTVYLYIYMQHRI